MATESWAEKSRSLAAAGLVVMGRDAQTKIEALSNLSPLIEAATASSTRLLTSQSIDELLTIVPTEETITEAEATTQRKSQTLQATLARPETGQAIGRTIAPITPNEPSPVPRPHGLDHYRMQDFPMQASDIDVEIEIHFDITGSSRTEGKMIDIQSFFGDRLKQIRNQLISGGALPRRPVSIAEAWRNRQRHTSKDYEITLVGPVSYTHLTLPTNREV